MTVSTRDHGLHWTIQCDARELAAILFGLYESDDLEVLLAFTAQLSREKDVTPKRQ